MVDLTEYTKFLHVDNAQQQGGLAAHPAILLSSPLCHWLSAVSPPREGSPGTSGERAINPSASTRAVNSSYVVNRAVIFHIQNNHELHCLTVCLTCEAYNGAILVGRRFAP
jgi:hypothetical protein